MTETVYFKQKTNICNEKLGGANGQWRNNRVDRVDNVQGPPSARGPRVPDQKYISLATQSKFDLIHYSYSVSTPVDVDLSLKVK